MTTVVLPGRRTTIVRVVRITRVVPVRPRGPRSPSCRTSDGVNVRNSRTAISCSCAAVADEIARSISSRQALTVVPVVASFRQISPVSNRWVIRCSTRRVTDCLIGCDASATATIATANSPR